MIHKKLIWIGCFIILISGMLFAISEQNEFSIYLFSFGCVNIVLSYILKQGIATEVRRNTDFKRNPVIDTWDD